MVSRHPMERFIRKDIEDYCIGVSSRPSPVCEALAKHTQDKVPMAVMLCGPMEGSLLGFLVRLVGAKSVLEIGTFTGYSALAMAEQLPSDGKLVTLDVDPETTAIGKSYWDQSPHGQKIESKVGPALESILGLPGPFDFVFIDADKTNYLNYVKATLPKLSTGGMIAVDNSLWSGAVLEENPEDESTKAIKEMTQWVQSNSELYCTLAPIRDGLLLIQKRS